MKENHFVCRLEGPPIAAKSVQKSKNHFYNPRMREKKIIQEKLKKYWGSLPIDKPVQVFMTYARPIPKTASKSLREKMLARKIFPITKPDIDNYHKFYFDCLKGIVIKDDALIVREISSKIYSEIPHIHIEVDEIY